MFGMGASELLVVFIIALILIGPRKLPELAKGLGKAVRQFQDAAKGLTDQLQDANDSVTNETKKIADAVRQDETTPPVSPLDDKDKPQT
jgi:Tat protein translocase TatB subunit